MRWSCPINSSSVYFPLNGKPEECAPDGTGKIYVNLEDSSEIAEIDAAKTVVTRHAPLAPCESPSGIAIDRNDVIYVADSESGSVAKDHGAWKRGMRIGSARDGSVKFFIPDPVENATGTSAAEGVAVDTNGVIYGAEVGPKDLKKYVRN